LGAVGTHGAVRDGRRWKVGDHVLPEAAIRRLIRAGYLTGKRGDQRRDLSPLGRLAVDPFEPMGESEHPLKDDESYGGDS